MNEWLSPLLVFAGIVVGFIGSLLGHRVAAGKNKNDLQQAMIDQIQEERNRLDDKLEKQEKRHAEDVDKLNRRISGFYADKSASRKYIGMLESHIFQGKPPPPPTPPTGYVP